MSMSRLETLGSLVLLLAPLPLASNIDWAWGPSHHDALSISNPSFLRSRSPSPTRPFSGQVGHNRVAVAP